MPPAESASLRKVDRLLVFLLLVPIVLGLGAVLVFAHGAAKPSLFFLANLVGPTTQSLMHGDGLTVCTDAMGTPVSDFCFHAARMPFASVVVALGVGLFGDHFLAVNLFKAVLLLLPLELAIYLVWRRMPRSGPRRIATALLLLAPFAITAFLADVVNMQVEEGYSYSLLALAVAVLFFAVESGPTASLSYAVVFALAVDGVYLAKSSMIFVAFVLLLSYFLLERRRTFWPLVLLLVAAAPTGWALHQQHVSGRYTFGTSLDGINLHKANNPESFAHYPPPPGDTLDRYDSGLSSGHRFTSEWDFNDFHKKAGFAYMQSHPGETFRGDLRKLYVIFISLQKYGSSKSQGVLRYAETSGLLLFHLLLWAAIAAAVFCLIRPAGQDRSRRLIGAVFLALIAACIFPYLLGFVYTRHVSVLIYPAVLMCCRMLQDGIDPSGLRQDSAAHAKIEM
jgi:hypothetical protein